MDLRYDYETKIQTVLEPFSVALRIRLAELMQQHHIKCTPQWPEVRVKEVESFLAKALQRGKPYQEPLVEITDQVAARIVVLFESDIARVRAILQEHFVVTESRDLTKSVVEPKIGIKVGYRSLHLLLRPKIETTPDPWESLSGFEDVVFEVQIRTLLQHAWAEIEHAFQYKATGQVPEDLSRRIYILSGLLELADSEFASLKQTLDQVESKRT